MQSSNFVINREFWDNYANQWNKHQVPIDNENIASERRDEYINYLGDEWGRVDDVVEIVNEYITPFISAKSIAAEIGVGGGRIAAKVVPQVQNLHCFDISPEMLNKAKAALNGSTNVEFHLLEDFKFDPEFTEKFDFVYSFDVFVHLDLQSIWKYLNSIYQVLNVGGKAFIHTTNITTLKGWERFAAEANGEILYYPTSPEAIKLLINKAQMQVLKESIPDGKNFYLERDYLVVMQK
ncbi:methyltransferase domain-containing protein [Calothrix sp. FACHB-156]|nr:methyltransferase domain-containing protein [Nostoc linckia FACHB-104]MBD2340827.1 methyltransferase domain-containing protein [Calothrix sp. FACHB-156]